MKELRPAFLLTVRDINKPRYFVNFIGLSGLFASKIRTKDDNSHSYRKIFGALRLDISAPIGV
jgi:hypothetical protein